jgi:hypothetical protein
MRIELKNSKRMRPYNGRNKENYSIMAVSRDWSRMSGAILYYFTSKLELKYIANLNVIKLFHGRDLAI